MLKLATKRAIKAWNALRDVLVLSLLVFGLLACGSEARAHTAVDHFNLYQGGA
jgi:hypothetical protein